MTKKKPKNNKTSKKKENVHEEKSVEDRIMEFVFDELKINPYESVYALESTKAIIIDYLHHVDEECDDEECECQVKSTDKGSGQKEIKQQSKIPVANISMYG